MEGDGEFRRVILIAFATGVAVGILVRALTSPPVAVQSHGDCGCKGKVKPPAPVLRLVHTFEEAPPKPEGA